MSAAGPLPAAAPTFSVAEAAAAPFPDPAERCCSRTGADVPSASDAVASAGLVESVGGTVVVGADVAAVAKPGRGIQAGSARVGNETAGMVTLGSQPVRP